MFGGLMWLIALLVVLVVGAAGIGAFVFHSGRGRPRIDGERRRDPRTG